MLNTKRRDKNFEKKKLINQSYIDEAKTLKNNEQENVKEVIEENNKEIEQEEIIEEVKKDNKRK